MKTPLHLLVFNIIFITIGFGSGGGGAQQFARLEPIYGQVVNAAGQCGTDDNGVYYGCEGFLGYSKYLTDARPLGIMTYLPLTDPPQKVFDNLGIFQKLIMSNPLYQPPNTTLGFQIGLWFADTCTGCPFVPRAEQVANGTYDSSINAMITAFSDCSNFPLFCSSPIWLRIGFEFNGEWNMYSPDAYKAAFIRITQKLRANPHTEKYVATVWDYSTDAEAARLDYSQWYPGDVWVDWWGVNVFSDRFGHSGPNNQNVLKFLTEASAKKFPVLLGEVTPRGYPVTDGQVTWNAWFDPYFRLIGNTSFTIRFASYINWNWAQSQWNTWGDAEVEVNPIVGENYMKEMMRKNNKGDLAWLHLGTTEETLSRINLSGGKMA